MKFLLRKIALHFLHSMVLIAFLGVYPRDIPEICFFKRSNKNPLNPWGIGHNNHTNFPSLRDKRQVKAGVHVKAVLL